MTDLTHSPLGRATTYGERYDPELLYPVERAPLRTTIGIGADLPFHGEDLWTAYELSWLDARGKPAIAIATLRVPASSPCIVESKSVKLYLTAFNQTRFASPQQVQDVIARDLGAATRTTVAVALTLPPDFASLPHAEPAGTLLDDLPLARDDHAFAPEALRAGEGIADETLVTRLFRSVCPVTGQPDYASIVIAYRGPAIERTGLLRYLVSYRNEPGFHEHCVERIFVDVWRRCTPSFLTVHGRFTRRGGIDINPYRSSAPMASPRNARTARQ